MADWYNVKLSDFMANHGEVLVLKYNNSPSKTVMHIYQEHDWKGWLFSETSNFFWDDDKNVLDCISFHMAATKLSGD